MIHDPVAGSGFPGKGPWAYVQHASTFESTVSDELSARTLAVTSHNHSRSIVILLTMTCKADGARVLESNNCEICHCSHRFLDHNISMVSKAFRKNEQANMASNLLCVVNVYDTLLRGLLLFVTTKRSLSEDLILSCLPIKHFSNLFKSTALGLREKEINSGNHCRKSADVDEVELPGDGFECDRIAELVEN
jgi:hypothetical protein